MYMYMYLCMYMKMYMYMYVYMYMYTMIYGGFLSHRGTPVLIHFFMGFSIANYPATLGYPHDEQETTTVYRPPTNQVHHGR